MTSGYDSSVKPQRKSKAFDFGANATGNLQAHCKKCGNEARVEYEDTDHAPRTMVVSCEHCNISHNFKTSITFKVTKRRWWLYAPDAK